MSAPSTPRRVGGDPQRGHSPFGVRSIASFARAPLPFLERWAAVGGDVSAVSFLGTPWVLLNHPDDIADYFSRSQDELGRDDYITILKRVLGNGLLTSDGELWRRQRKLAAVAFTPKRIKGYAKRMSAVTAEGLSRWTDGAHVDLHDEVSRLTMEVVADVLFGTGVREGEVTTVRESLEVANDYFAQSPEAILRLPTWVPTPRHLRFKKAVRAIDGVVYRIIDERRSAGAAAKDDDLLGALLAAKGDDGAGMDDTQLRDEVVTLFLAGHETTALALVHSLAQLARHPECERRLLAELRSVLGTRLPTEEDVPRLVYTERVVKEAMRIHPPAWMTGREAMHDIHIAGIDVPKGAQIVVSQWLVQRDSRWFPDPEAFDPDRWAPEVVATRPRMSYFPFGGGARICIGNHFAMMEATLMLACIVQRFHVALEPFERLDFQPSVTLRPKRGLRAELRARTEVSPALTTTAAADAE